jgi:hypothetical protein
MCIRMCVCEFVSENVFVCKRERERETETETERKRESD